jgi:hypothetical protein
MNIGFTEVAVDVGLDADVATLSGTTQPGSAGVAEKKP